MQPGKTKALDAITHAAQRGELDESTARQLHALGVEAVALAMLAVSKHIAELQRWSQTQAPSPSTATHRPGQDRRRNGGNVMVDNKRRRKWSADKKLRIVLETLQSERLETENQRMKNVIAEITAENLDLTKTLSD